MLAQLPANATVYASGLEGPRGLAFGPDGTLYVAEAGLGGTNVGNCRLEHQVVAIIGKAGVTLAIQRDVAALPSVSSNSTELPRRRSLRYSL